MSTTNTDTKTVSKPSNSKTTKPVDPTAVWLAAMTASNEKIIEMKKDPGTREAFDIAGARVSALCRSQLPWAQRKLSAAKENKYVGTGLAFTEGWNHAKAAVEMPTSAYNGGAWLGTKVLGLFGK